MKRLRPTLNDHNSFIPRLRALGYEADLRYDEAEEPTPVLTIKDNTSDEEATLTGSPSMSRALYFFRGWLERVVSALERNRKPPTAGHAIMPAY
jgi:hypothetical protein